MTKPFSILMVCLGNICRSPTAEGVLRLQLEQAGLGGQVRVDSVGTGDSHVGQAPDSRAIACANKHGVDISTLRARRLTLEDFDAFDVLLCADRSVAVSYTHLDVYKRQLIASLSGAKVRVDRDRVAAAQALREAGCDVVVCDDGLQHYRLARDIEIEVQDLRRRYGNGRLLPCLLYTSRCV